MAYSDFTLEMVSTTFQISIKQSPIFSDIEPATVPEWLTNWIARTLPFALGSEKARSEFLVAPILAAWIEQSAKPLALYSGERFDVVPDQGLLGECDFIISNTPPVPFIQSPIVTLVEAKKHDIEAGFGQCAAQMVAAKLFNERRQHDMHHVFGCVTNGENWHFLVLENNLLTIDNHRYYLDNLGILLGVLHSMSTKI